jgi:hypothetical protein
MARIRNIKPEFWQDEELAELPRDARLMYVGLWNLADEHGRLRGAPRYIKGQLFPYDDDLTAKDIDDLMEALVRAGKVHRYRVTGADYLWLPNLDRHQRLESAKVPSKLPVPIVVDGADKSARRSDLSAPCADESERTTDESITHLPPEQPQRSTQIRADKSAPRADKLSLSYGTGDMGQGTGNRGHGGASAPRADKPRAPTGTRIPDDFAITDELVTWAANNAPRVDPQRETERFVDYWRGVAGTKGTKTDWIATWRNWLRRAQDDQAGGGNGTRASPANGSRYQPYRDNPAADYHAEL